MTQDDFDAFILEARNRGLTHVKTAAGWIPLAEWRPYGAFDGSNPGIEKYIGGFVWIGPTRAKESLPEPSTRPVALGVWEFRTTKEKRL